MKSSLVLASLFAAAQAQFSIRAPAPGTTLKANQNVTVQIIVPIDTSAEAGQEEVSLVIGVVGCGSSACPAPSADLGDVLFIGKYQGQGEVGTTLNTFENFTFTVPTDITGPASIQVQHITLTTPPGHAFPGIEYASVAVHASSGSLNVHPNSDETKCVGIQGGVYANGTAVDIFDCNASATQKWQWNDESLTSINPADGSQWCLDAGVNSAWANGVKMKIWQCFANLPQQTWTPITLSNMFDKIQLTTANFCLDLTNGNKTNSNILQIWQCTENDLNQIWTVTAA